MKSLNYSRKPDDTWVKTEGVVDESDPLYQKAKALAETDPGRIVCGWRQENAGDLVAEEVKFLDEMTPGATENGDPANQT